MERPGARDVSPRVLSSAGRTPTSSPCTGPAAPAAGGWSVHAFATDAIDDVVHRFSAEG